MSQILKKSEVHQLMSVLNADQRNFLETYSKQSKKSKWIEAIAKRKGIVIDEATPYEEIEPLIEDWVLVDVLDSGFGNRHYRCECGRELRYQYRVLHKKEQKVYGYGVSCFEHHTNLSPEVVRDILKEFHTVDLERDEILTSYFAGKSWDLKPFLYVSTLPFEILEQNRVGLPLTHKQRAKVIRMKEVYDEERRKRLVWDSMNERQKGLFLSLKEEDQQELVLKMSDVEMDGYFPKLPAGFLNEEVLEFYSAGLPLLDRQLDHIQEYEWEQYRKRILGASSKSRTTQYQPAQPYSKAPEVNTANILAGPDYVTLLERHLQTLKLVRANEERIPEGLKKDWQRIEDQVRGLKGGKEMDYSSFKLNLSNICYALRIKLDGYL